MSKKEKAQAIYNEMLAASADGKVSRKDFVARAMAEAGLSTAGAGTYYQNCKTVAAGGTIKTYYKPASERAAGATTATAPKGEDNKESAPLFSIVVLADGKVEHAHAFMSEEKAIQKWGKLNAATKARCVVVDGCPAIGASVETLQLRETA